MAEKRTYADRREELKKVIARRREIEAGITQLSEAIQNEKRGELLETLIRPRRKGQSAAKQRT